MRGVVHILHLEDDPADAELVKASLREGHIDCEIVRVEGRSDFEREVLNGKHHVIFSDHRLPAYDGMTALAFALEHRPNTPFILVSGAVGEEAAVRALLGGATDYVLKDHLSRLVPSLQRVLREADERQARTRAESALLSSEQRYRRLFEAAKDGIMLIDATTAQILDVNPSVLALLGYTAEQLLGQTPKIICGGDEATCTAFRSTLSHDHVRNSGIRLRKASGPPVDVEFVSSSYEVDGQRIVQINIRDITERKAAEDEIRRLNRELEGRVRERTADLMRTNAFIEATLQSMVEGILATDLQGQITWFSERFLSVCQVPGDVRITTLDQLTNEIFLPRIPKPEDFLKRENELRAHPENDGFDVLEFKDGRELERSSRPQRIGDEIVGRVWSYRDITDRRQMERQLQQGQKLEAVGQLAAGIAHELNTPAQFVGDNLAFIRESCRAMSDVRRAYKELLSQLEARPGFEKEIAVVRAAEDAADMTYLEENLPTSLASAEDGIGRMSAIVRAMKEFAHPQQKEAEYADINRAIEATLTIARNEYKYVAEALTELGDLPPVLCTIGDLNQVFLNLIVNAAHAIADRVAIEGGRGRICVRTRRLDDANVTIEVEDTGCGIAPEIRERVFDPFFTTKVVGRGSGQGLAIARSIVVGKHGGNLSFTSDVGHGTTFTITLPIASVRSPESA